MLLQQKLTLKTKPILNYNKTVQINKDENTHRFTLSAIRGEILGEKEKE